MLDLRILGLLHRTYKPFSTLELQSGHFDLLIITDQNGLAIRVCVSMADAPDASKGQWYRRVPTSDKQASAVRHSWERE